MTDLIVNNACNVARLVNKADPYSYIANFTPAIYWLYELYKEMVKEEQITDFKELGANQKLIYWTAACMSAPDKPKWLRIQACYAMYLFEIIDKPLLTPGG